MNSKSILGVVIALVGVAMFFFSMNIMDQVSEGRERISSGQKRVDQGKSLFNMTPVTKEVGEGLASPLQRRIDAGTEEADRYQQLATWLKIGGIVFIIIGAGVFFMARKK